MFVWTQKSCFGEGGTVRGNGTTAECSNKRAVQKTIWTTGNRIYNFYLLALYNKHKIKLQESIDQLPGQKIPGKVFLLCIFIQLNV